MFTHIGDIVKSVYGYLFNKQEISETICEEKEVYPEEEITTLKGDELHNKMLKDFKEELKISIVNKHQIAMDRIILCWTGSDYKFNGLDIARYHYAVDNDGNIYDGKYSIFDNFDIERSPDGYARFTRGLNDRCISVAMTGMGDMKFDEDDLVTVKKYPITKKQYDSFCLLVSHLSEIYHVPLNYKNILSRAEIQKSLRKDQAIRHDIKFLPIDDDADGNELWCLQDPIYIGNRIRDNIYAMKNL